MRITTLPPPGINSNDTVYSSPGIWSNGSNVRFFQGKPQALGSEMVAASGFDNIRKMLAYDIGGTPSLALAGTTNLYSLNRNTYSATDITPAADWISAPAYSLDMFGDILLASPTRGGLFESTAGAQAVATTNAPAEIVKIISTPSRQIMALGCNEELSGTFNSRCIRWCDIEDRTAWTTLSSNNAGEYILAGQEAIVSGCVLGQYILIWTTGSLWIVQYLGDPGQTYEFTRVAETGIVAHGAYAIHKGVAYWMDQALSVWEFAPGGLPTKIPCTVSSDLIGAH